MTTGVMALTAWSLLAAIWWAVAWWFLLASRRRTPEIPASPVPAFSIFKAIPAALDEDGHSQIAGAIESFIGQLDTGDEMLLGIPTEHAESWRPVLDRWATEYPGAKIKAIIQPAPVQRANPKIAWMEVMAPSASCEHWLWSDADIVAPPRVLDSLREELRKGCVAATCAYRVRTFSKGAAALDALFINSEFLPGVLLLGARGFSASAFGAAVAFPGHFFRERVSWEEIGNCLADDFIIGQRLAPVRLSPVIVNTLSLQTHFVAAIRHYYRWHKTLRWCRPLSYAALLAITPLVGWLVSAVLLPAHPGFMAGFFAQWLFEVGIAVVLLRAAGCRWPIGASWMLALWPIIRCLSWIASWLPISVVWVGARGRWFALRARP